MVGGDAGDGGHCPGSGDGKLRIGIDACGKHSTVGSLGAWCAYFDPGYFYRSYLSGVGCDAYYSKDGSASVLGHGIADGDDISVRY